MSILLKLLISQVILISFTIAAPTCPCNCQPGCSSQSACNFNYNFHQDCDPYRGQTYQLRFDRGPEAEASYVQHGSTGLYDTVIEDVKILPTPSPPQPQPCIIKDTPEIGSIIKKFYPVSTLAQESVSCNNCQQNHQCNCC